MSLLFGSWAAGSSHDDPDDLARCAAALGRYPGIGRVREIHDDHGFLAHGQAIVTPEDRYERQPSLHGDGRFVLAVDGFLANRGELTGALPPIAGDALPDSAIVAAALLRWGDDALDRLHGDFALAWWDRADRRLLLACDRVGGRPLFYHAAEGRLVWANLVASLFVHPSVPRVLDADMVARAVLPHAPDLERTCFQGVRQLLPGHKLVWTPTGMQVSRYWRLDPSRRIRLRRDEDYVEAARELLDKVVGEALRAEGPLLAMLSGGLDSSGVAATAARLIAPGPLHTVTLRPDPAGALPPCSPGAFQDEWSHAQAVAALHPNMIAHDEAARLEPIEDLLRAHMALNGRPPVHLMAATWMDGVWRVSRTLGAKVVLGGLSGNATLSASARPRMLRPALADLPAAVMDALWDSRGGRWRVSLKRLLRTLPPDGPAWMTNTALRPEISGRIGIKAIQRAFMTGDSEAPWRQRGRMRLMERTWMGRTMIAPLRLRRGAELRDPLGDVRFMEFCLAIPPDQFTRSGRDRFLARRVLADRLPPQVAREQRKGRQGAEWFDWLTQSRPWLAAELDRIEASSLGRELIDTPRLRAILDDWPADAAEAEPHYHRLANILGRGVGLGNYIRWAEGSNF